MAKGHLDEFQKAKIVCKSTLVLHQNTLLNKSQVISCIIEVVVADRFHCISLNSLISLLPRGVATVYTVINFAQFILLSISLNFKYCP